MLLETCSQCCGTSSDLLVKNAIFNLVFLLESSYLSYNNAMRQMSQVFIGDRSIMVQVMAWCCRQQAITWTSVDQDHRCHMASLGLNEVTAVTSTLLCHFIPSCLQQRSYFGEHVMIFLHENILREFPDGILDCLKGLTVTKLRYAWGGLKQLTF